ncbi:hypothetical protein AB0F17_45410 [Nonomuraea sp. NPDC026600]|uniref:hypothetical protein n=1 Tax=Nonomuraea sp. NPDC026600 TaxID=3155363 RepID=UPI0033FB5CC5
MTGNLTLDVFVAAGIVAAGLGLLAVLGRGGRWLWQFFQRLDNFSTTCEARLPSPGWRRAPASWSDLKLEDGLITVAHEVATNDGSSLKDSAS